MRVLLGLAVYAGILGFCVGIYTFVVWLYLGHPVGFAFLLLVLLAAVAWIVWDDLTGQEQETA